MQIRCALTLQGNIEAAIMDGRFIRRVVVDCRTGNLIETNVPTYSDIFRKLVKAARQFAGEPL